MLHQMDGWQGSNTKIFGQCSFMKKTHNSLDAENYILEVWSAITMDTVTNCFVKSEITLLIKQKYIVEEVDEIIQ